MATQPVSGVDAVPETRGAQPHLGERHLTTLHAIGQALAIGPIFSVGLVSGLVANVAGYSTPASIVLGSIGSIGLAYVIAIYARRFAGAGAIFEYLSHAVHNSFGIFSGGVYLLGTMFLGAGGIYIGLGFLIQGYFAAHIHTLDPVVDGRRGVPDHRVLPRPLRRPHRDPRRAAPRDDLEHPIPHPRPR